MLSPKSLVLTVAVALSLSALSEAQSPAPVASGVRTWTTSEGRTFPGTLVKIEGQTVYIRIANGQVANIALTRLSAADQAFLSTPAPAPATPAPATAATPKAGATPAATAAAAGASKGKRTWPPKVEVDTKAIEVSLIEEKPADGRYVYHSQNFEFVSGDKLAGSVMKEIARTFEATRTLVDALPWGVNPKPPADKGFYEAQFYVTRESYIAAGGPPESGGVYFSKDRVFRIPFPSLGLEMRGKTWFKNENYRGDTIVHEITHQMMHDLLPFLPTWVTEGSAEYTEMLPYNAGRFLSGSHERGIKEYLKEMEKRGITMSSSDSIVSHMRMEHDKWEEGVASGHKTQVKQYMLSCLLVYYFSHLDGDGSGARWFKYLDKIEEARDAWAEFFKRPEVKMGPNGGFRFPRNSPPPSIKRNEEYGLSNIDILLDGRSDDQFQKDFMAGYRKIGIKLQ